jgi:hypothetical protein
MKPILTLFAALVIALTTGTASAASLADLGLNGTLPAGWTLEKENEIYSIADENEDLICGISYLNLPATEKDLQELQQELAETDSEYADYSKSALATVLHKGHKLFVLSAPSKSLPDLYAHDVKLRYGDSVYCLYFFSDEAEFKYSTYKSLLDSLFPNAKTASTSQAQGIRHTPEAPQSWTEPNTGFVFPAPAGMTLVGQTANAATFRASNGDELHISVSPLRGSAFNGISNRQWRPFVLELYRSGYHVVEQFKVADIWSLYLVKSEGRKIIHFVDFDLRKNSFRLTWTDYINDSRPIYDYLDRLQKPTKK